MNTLITEISLYIPISMPEIDFIEDSSEKSTDLVCDMLNELCSLSEKLEIDLLFCNVCKPRIELLPAEVRKQLPPEWKLNIIDEREILNLSTSIPLTIEFETSNPVLTKEQRLEIVKFTTSQEFTKRILDLLMVCNLSRVGSIEWKDIFVCQDENWRKDINFPHISLWPIWSAAQMVSQTGWPKLHTIEFLKVWNWVNQNEGFSAAFGGGPTGRALNALSRLLQYDYQDQAMQLLWSLVGVEALYGKGKASVMDQIREKTQAFLGKQDNFKKKFNQMYDFRSRFMHGDLDFPGLFFLWDARLDFEEYNSSLGAAVDMAVAILIATLQEMIIRDWSGLNFNYSVSNLS